MKVTSTVVFANKIAKGLGLEYVLPDAEAENLLTLVELLARWKMRAGGTRVDWLPLKERGIRLWLFQENKVVFRVEVRHGIDDVIDVGPLQFANQPQNNLKSGIFLNSVDKGPHSLEVVKRLKSIDEALEGFIIECLEEAAKDHRRWLSEPAKELLATIAKR